MKTHQSMKMMCLYLAITFLVTGALQETMAIDVGPENSPPGGVTINDNDPGDGEKWGRVGGRELIFSNIQLSEFDRLLWGIATATGVGIAFDGSIDDPNETLSFNAFESNPFLGKAVWTGQTQVKMHNDIFEAIDTKFILTVTDNFGTPVTLSDIELGFPYADVTEKDTFKAKLEMQARNLAPDYVDCPTVPEGEFGPALDVFDCLKTSTDAENDAITEFYWGFFYDLAAGPGPGPEIGLDDHDAHITDLIGVLQATVNDVDWFVEDWRLVKPGLLNNQGDILWGIGEIDNTLDSHGTLLESVRQNTDDLSGQISNLPNLNLMLLLFGITHEEVGIPADPNLPPFEAIAQLSDLYQTLNQMNADLTGLQSSLGLYTQEQVDALIAAATAAKDAQIAQLINQIATMHTEEQLQALISQICPGNSENAPPGKNK